MITSKVTSRVTKLQFGIGLLVHENILIQDLYDYGITSSYDEIRCFKISAAVLVRNRSTGFDGALGLVQGSKWIKINSLFCYYNNPVWWS